MPVFQIAGFQWVRVGPVFIGSKIVNFIDDLVADVRFLFFCVLGCFPRFKTGHAVAMPVRLTAAWAIGIRGMEISRMTAGRNGKQIALPFGCMGLFSGFPDVSACCHSVSRKPVYRSFGCIGLFCMIWVFRTRRSRLFGCMGLLSLFWIFPVRRAGCGGAMGGRS